jgi:uroporphyrinogen-III synthase
VGPATARALADAGVPVACIAAEHVAEALADALGDVEGRRVLWPRAAGARDVLATRLRARGAVVDEVVVYQSVPAPLPLDAAERVRGADAVTFASPSAVRCFVDALGGSALGSGALGTSASVRVACIGPVTEAAARAAGLRVDAVASPYTDAGMVDALTRAFTAGTDTDTRH